MLLYHGQVVGGAGQPARRFFEVIILAKWFHHHKATAGGSCEEALLIVLNFDSAALNIKGCPMVIGCMKEVRLNSDKSRHNRLQKYLETFMPLRVRIIFWHHHVRFWNQFVRDSDQSCRQRLTISSLL